MMGLSHLLLLIFTVFFKGCNTTTFHDEGQVSYCHDEERTALLQFKQNFTINCTRSSGLPGAYPKVTSWKPTQGRNKTNCCTWDGVECEKQTGHVIALDLKSSCLYGSISSNSSLFRLIHLQRLSLADNDFNFSHIPGTVRNFPRLTYLDLSASVFSGQIPPQLSQLVKLSLLNLSSNTDPTSGEGLLRLDGSNFGNIVRNLTRLEHLRLSYINISSTIPHSIANLSFLTTLDLRQCELLGHFPVTIFHLPNLQGLSVRDNQNLNGKLPEFNGSSHLITLNLHRTNFSGKFPTSIAKIDSLELLNVGGCYFTEEPVPSSLGNLRQLTYLDLSWLFRGSIPHSFANLTKLTTFRMLSCGLTGPIPSWLGRFSQLTYLDFAFNTLNRSIPTSFSNLTSLEILFVQENQLSGTLELQMFQNLRNLNQVDLSSNSLELLSTSVDRNATTSLEVLKVQENQMRGTLNFQMFQSFKNLQKVDLSSNNLERLLSPSIHMNTTSSLEILYLQINHLSGKFELQSFLELKNLKELDLALNNLELVSKSTDTNGTDVPQFTILNLLNSKLGEFPEFIKHQKSLERLDLNDCNLHGQVPKWMYNVSINTMMHLALTNNHLSGELPVVLPWLNLQYLSVAGNNFHGSLPTLPTPASSTIVYFADRNNFSGEVSPSFCSMSSLMLLDLSNNSLSGTIPSCFRKLSSLQALVLSHNKIGGKFPQFLGNFSENLMFLLVGNNSFHGNLLQTFTNKSNLRFMDVSHNKLEGSVPRSLGNCLKLETLVMSNNNLSDVFPFWLRSLPELKVLVMRRNLFRGAIGKPENNQQFPKLRVLDISHNNFTGEFHAEYVFSENGMRPNVSIDDPTYMQATMFYNTKVSYGGSFGFTFSSTITITSKGVDRYYSKVHKTMAFVDISSNKFEGEIDAWIGNLIGLLFLNVSNNLLNGSIPLSFGKLINLESLDLSSNKLSGEIPQQLTQLTFLAELNVSHNNLSGRIPTGTQLQGFDVTSYEGNFDLCGAPLPRKCGKSNIPAEVPPSDKEDNNNVRIEFDWKFVVAGFGSGLVVGVVLADMAITRRPEIFLDIVRRSIGLMYTITSVKRFRHR